MPRLGHLAWPLAGLTLLAVLAGLNQFPANTVFANGDVVQYFDRAFVERNFRHIWANVIGEGGFSSSFAYYPFYRIVFALSDLLGLEQGQQSSAYMFLFWGGSYLGFLAGAMVLRDRVFSLTSPEASAYALAYAINPYTFYAFYFIWGYSPFLSLYILAPVLVASTLEFFAEDSHDRIWRLAAIQFLAHLGATVAYGNLPFFVAANGVLFSLVLLTHLFTPARSWRHFLVRGTAFVAIELLAVGWAVLPQLPHLLFEIGAIGSEIFDYASWILWQRLNLWEVFTTSPDAKAYAGRHPYTAWLFFAMFAAAIACFVASARAPTARTLAVLIVCLGIVLLESKGKGIAPEAFTVWAYSNPVLGALRSYGKLMVLLPCMLMLLILFTASQQSSRARRLVLVLLVAANIAATYPIFAGQLQTREGSALKSGKRCDDSEYCALVRIPGEYRQAAEAIRRDGAAGKILSLPYSVYTSPGWTNYPRWKHVGVDPTVQLFSLPVVHANTFHTFGYPYAERWAQGIDNPESILSTAGDLGVTYLLFHYDVRPEFIYPAKLHLRAFHQAGLTSLIFDSDVVAVYRLAPQYLRGPVTLHGSDGRIEEPLQVTRIDPTKYVVAIDADSKASDLVFRESFSSLWSVFVLPDAEAARARRGKTESRSWESFLLTSVGDSAHVRFASYGNAWKLDLARLCSVSQCPVDQRSGRRVLTLLLEYRAQRYLDLLSIIAMIGALVAGAILLASRFATPRAGQHFLSK